MTAIDNAEIDAINEAVRDLNQALVALLADPPDAGPARVRAIVALEALENARRRLARDMVKEMLATGVTQFKEGLWSVSVRPGRVTCSIEDPRAVPPMFRRETPDIPAIRRHLEQHPSTNWATLQQGEPFLEIRTKR